MDPTQRAFYRQAANLQYLKLRRTAFQDWFNKLMSTRHADDYVSVRLSKGDGSLDGYVLSSLAVFQVFAPRTSTAAEMTSKIEGDFADAKKTMEERGLAMKGWVFVHNDPDDMPHEAILKLSELEKSNPGVKIRRWGFDAIWQEHAQLSIEQLQDMYGLGPTDEEVRTLAFPAIKTVIEFLAKEKAPPVPPVDFPSPKKLEYNDLSPEYADVLRSGRTKQALVGQYLDGASDADAGEEIAQAFRNKYAELRGAGMSADEIFEALWQFSGFQFFASQPKHSAAVIAVISYFFERCDIFENVP